MTHAGYTGLAIEKHTTVSVSGVSYDVWRLYANFSDPGDRLVAGFGGQLPTYPNLVVESRNASDTGAGNPFFAVPGNITAPTQAQIAMNAGLQWHSFVTIGVPIADLAPEGDQIILTPGFPGVSGTVWTLTNDLWFVPPTIPDVGGTPPMQSVAGWTGDGDAQLRVMLMQLTVRAGENVRGTVNLDWFPPVGQGGGNVVIHQPFQTFNSFAIPTPSAVAVLAIAALMRRSRLRIH
jgi:hypothetical protein